MKLDLKLLKRLLIINHPTASEWPMLSAIINECYKIGGLEFEMDSYCNIFITKNTTNPDYYCCVVAHTDCVLSCENKQVVVKDGMITGYNPVTKKQVGLGADDTNGICVAIQLLKVIPDLKVCFTTEEECGYVGASEAAENINFFNDVSYLIQADRHGKSDLITYTNCINSASDEWLQEASPIMAKYGYSEAIGLGTDIGELAEKLQLSGVNVSCGYYKEHTNNEYTVISELQNCLNFIEEIIRNVPTNKQYEIEVKDPYAYWKTYGTTAYDNPTDDYYDDLPCNHCESYDCMNCPYDNLWDNYGKESKTTYVY